MLMILEDILKGCCYVIGAIIAIPIFLVASPFLLVIEILKSLCKCGDD